MGQTALPRPAPIRRLPLLVLAGVAGVAGWAAPRALSEGVPTPAASEVLVDEGYRLRLLRPAPAWVLLDAAHVATQVPGALLGAASVSGAFAAVSVARAPDVDLEAFARQRLERPAFEGLEVLESAPQRYGAFAGHRVTSTFRVGTVAFVEEDTVFRRGDFLYLVEARAPATLARGTSLAGLAWALLPGASPRAPSPEAIHAIFRPFHEALDLLPGDLAPRPASALHPPQLRGTRWRMRDGVFVSAMSRMSIAPPPGWALLPPSEVLAMDPGAESGWVHPATGTVLLALDEPRLGRPEAACEAGYARRMAALLGPAAAVDPQPMDFLHAALPLRRTRIAQPWPREFGWGQLVGEERVHQVQVYVPPSHAEEAWEATAGLLRSMTPLSEAAREALLAEEAAGPPPEEAIGPGTSLREGVWRSHELGVRWTMPSRDWRILLPRDLAMGPQLFLAEDRASGAIFRLQRLGALGIVFEAADDDRRHALLVQEAFGSPRDPPATTLLPLGEVTARVTTAPLPVDEAAGLSIRQQLVTFRWQGSTYVGIGTAPDQGDSDAAKTFASMTSALRLEADPATRRVGPAHVEDLRMGYALRLEGEGWLVREETPEALAPLGSILHAMGPQQHVYALGLAVPSASDLGADLLFDLVQNELGLQLPGLAPGAGAADELADLPAERRTYVSEGERTDLAVARQGARLFVLVVSSRPDGSGLGWEAAKAAFGRLP